MANKRIKDLSDTATSMDAGDYLVVDAADDKTKKILWSDLSSGLGGGPTVKEITWLGDGSIPDIDLVSAADDQVWIQRQQGQPDGQHNWSGDPAGPPYSPAFVPYDPHDLDPPWNIAGNIPGPTNFVILDSKDDWKLIAWRSASKVHMAITTNLLANGGVTTTPYYSGGIGGDIAGGTHSVFHYGSGSGGSGSGGGATAFYSGGSNVINSAGTTHLPSAGETLLETISLPGAFATNSEVKWTINIGASVHNKLNSKTGQFVFLKPKGGDAFYLISNNETYDDSNNFADLTWVTKGASSAPYSFGVYYGFIVGYGNSPNYAEMKFTKVDGDTLEVSVKQEMPGSNGTTIYAWHIYAEEMGSVSGSGGSSLSSGETPPSTGDFWYDTINAQLYVKVDGAWVQANA